MIRFLAPRAVVLLSLAALTGTADARNVNVPLPPGGPVIALPTEKPTPIVYPECSRPMFVVQKGAYIFRCRLIADTPTEGLLPIAMSTDQCAPNAYWNDGPDLATAPAGPGKTSYTITCKHTN